MRQVGAPLGEQIALLVFGPPVMAALVWLCSRGLAISLQGGVASAKTKARQKVEFWVALVVRYAIGIAVDLYSLVKVTPPRPPLRLDHNEGLPASG